jgi:hypothetical protein
MQFDQLKRREICHDPWRHGYFAARCACQQPAMPAIAMAKMRSQYP